MFGQLEAACREWCEQVNARPHRESRRAPVEDAGRGACSVAPAADDAVHGGVRHHKAGEPGCHRLVEGVRYSVPHQLVDTRVWVRFHADDLVVTAVDPTLEGPRPGLRAGRGHPARALDPGQPVDPGRALPARDGGRHCIRRTHPHATSAAEAEFLALGPGAVLAGRGRRRGARGAPQ